MGSGKLVVEVCSAHNLMPKDGQGSANPYCVLDFGGRRHRTLTKQRDLNPRWNQKFEFVIDDSEMAMEDLTIQAFSESWSGMSRERFLGEVRIPGSSLWSTRQSEATIISYPMQKRSLWSHVRGELRLKIWYVDNSHLSKADQAEKTVDKANPAPAKQPEVKLSQSTTNSEIKPDQIMIKDERRSIAHSTVPATVIHPSEFALKETAPSLGRLSGERMVSFDLVEKMSFLFVRVAKARGLAARNVVGSSDPYVRLKISEGKSAQTRTVPRTMNPEWNQVFAFAKDKIQGPTLEISVWNEDRSSGDELLGGVIFELSEIPTRLPHDSLHAPNWYKLEEKKTPGGQNSSVKGEIMVSVWWGTQADEEFSEAWQSDAGGSSPHTRSKVYISPKLWYLRVSVIEAQDLLHLDRNRLPEVSVKAQLGSMQVQKTKPVSCRITSPVWNEDLMFVAAEPFEELLHLNLEDRIGTGKEELLGTVKVALHTVQRRLDLKQVPSSWYNLEKNGDKMLYRGRIHLRISLDGGYHVMDESTNHISDVRPTAKQLWSQNVGMLELGILNGRGFLPTKTRDGRGTTDAYCVAKYGQKWIRTRTIVDSFNPRWNEQYTWEVYDPCTVLTLGVFDNHHLNGNNLSDKSANGSNKDLRIGKVRIRLSILESNRVYTNAYPLVVMQPSGVKKMGEIELAIRFSCTSLLNVMQVYFRPPLPRAHYLHPLAVTQVENLRNTAIAIVAMRLARSEPPLRQEIVHYMLDTHSNLFSLRRSKANYFRLVTILSGAIAVAKWFTDICNWRNPVTTLLVHLLFVILVLYPQLILPTFFLYLFLIGTWQFRFRSRSPPSMDAKLSQAEQVEPDELDEEFDSFPTSKAPETVVKRYERLRIVASRIQTVAGDLASQLERVTALLSWRDPRATAIFIFFCLFAAIVLYITPLQLVAILSAFYVLRHPRFRNRLPPIPLNFFRRLPSLADRIL